MGRFGILIIVSLLMGAVCHAQESKAAAEASVVIRDGMISIVAAGAEIPVGATVIDGHSKTLIPGLIDAHTHTFAPEHLRAAIVFGVTTELDMFTSVSFAAGQRAEQVATALLEFLLHLGFAGSGRFCGG